MPGRILARLSIGQRIFSLAAVAVIAVLVLGATSLIGDRIFSSFLQHEKQALELDRLAVDVETRALQMRRREKDFLLRRDLKYAEKYEADAAEVMQRLEALSAHPLSAPLMADVEALLALLPQHQAHFRRVVELNTEMGLSEKEGLMGTLRKSVHAVEEELKEANLDPLTVKMLMMRRHEKDYMLRGATKYIERIDKRRAEFDALLAEAELEPADVEMITKLMDAYVAGFKTWAETDQKTRAETKKLSEVYAQMQPHLEAVFEAAAAELAAVEAEISALRQTTLVTTAGVSLAVLLLAIGAGLMIGRSIRRPLREMTEAMRALSEGQTDIEVPVSRVRDEFGEMGSAVGVFRDNAVERQRLEAEQAAEQRDKEKRTRAIDELIQSFEADSTRVLGELSSMADQLTNAAQQAKDTAEQSSKLSSSVAAGANEASENIGTVSAAAEQLTASISEISRKVTEASDIAGKAVTETQSTGATMRGMADAAVKIGDVVTLIQDIAEQTNLLALNATIEAARAGEAGKGFAVVASEVKSLATQTAKATEEISQQIAAIQTTSNEAVAANESVGEIIGQVSEVATAIASAVEEQNAATREIAGNVQVVAQSTAEVTENIGQVQTATEQTTGTAKAVDTTARHLTDEATSLREKIQAFIIGVRAA